MSTHLAGLGIDITHAEESVNHTHILMTHGGKRSQHEGRVACSILSVNLADPWERDQSIEKSHVPSPTWSTHLSPSVRFICVMGVVAMGHEFTVPFAYKFLPPRAMWLLPHFKVLKSQ